MLLSMFVRCDGIMKACGEVEEILIILILVLFGHHWSAFGTLLLYPQYAVDRRLDGLQCRSGRHGEVKIPEPTRTCTANTVL
jgi:hypothetical protein